ncbi:MAG: hypothetical protein F6J87_29460, partial [Spirulina sp. SIO3F2]|nr:hypothetical protein [Spirulina sp. SIO3F2]
EKPSEEKQKRIAELMHPNVWEEIEQAREIAINQSPEKQTKIQGGTMSENTFVSWVDELIWHSTPSTESRGEVTTQETAKKAVERYAERAKQEEKAPPATDEGNRVLKVLAYDEKSGFYQWLRNNYHSKQSVQTYWHSYQDEDLYKVMREDIQSKKPEAMNAINTDLEQNPGRWGGNDRYSMRRQVTEADAVESQKYPHATTHDAIHTNDPWVGRARANSDPKTMERIKQLKEEAIAKGEKRSFIRTWVRVEPKKQTGK